MNGTRALRSPVQAPPGAGKTTVVPLALLQHNPEYLRGGRKKILVRERHACACLLLRPDAGEDGAEAIRQDARQEAVVGVEQRDRAVVGRILHIPGLVQRGNGPAQEGCRRAAAGAQG